MPASQALHERTDFLRPAAGEEWCDGGRGLPEDGRARANVLPLVEAVRRHGRARDRLKQLEDENGKLKRLVTDLPLDRSMLQDVLKREW